MNKRIAPLAVSACLLLVAAGCGSGGGRTPASTVNELLSAFFNQHESAVVNLTRHGGETASQALAHVQTIEQDGTEAYSLAENANMDTIKWSSPVCAAPKGGESQCTVHFTSPGLVTLNIRVWQTGGTWKASLSDLESWVYD